MFVFVDSNQNSRYMNYINKTLQDQVFGDKYLYLHIRSSQTMQNFLTLQKKLTITKNQQQTNL